VDLFFVLSGFLITDILLKTVNQKQYFKNFYVKRVLRIFPLYYLSLILLLIILPRVKGFPLDFNYYINNQWWFWTYLQNWFLIFYNPGNTTTAIQHYWSLAIEEQFYLIWPFIIFLVRKPKFLLWIVVLLLLGVIITRFTMWTMKIKDLNYFGFYTFTRIDGICIGSMLAILHFMKSVFLKKYFTWVVLGLAGINFIFYFFNHQKQFTFPYLAIIGYTTFATLFALAIHESIQEENKILKLILGNQVLRFFGKVSYSFYVFHWPVYLIFFEPVQRWVAAHSSLSAFNVNIVTSVLLTLAGLLASVCSYYGFERHFLKLKKAFN
jgi:peptidoglycan/LPS O-acetylase OafA/YrhL